MCISSAWHPRRHCGPKTLLVAPCSAGVQCVQVQGQLRKGNADMAVATIEKEKLLQELRNQIAIIRWSWHLLSIMQAPCCARLYL